MQPSHVMPSPEDDIARRRATRIDQLLEELRLNTEDLHELAEQAHERAADTRQASRTIVAKAKIHRDGKGS